MKKLVSLTLSLALALGLTACGGGNPGAADSPAAQNSETPAPEAESVDVVVFAAASMEATLTEIADLYKDVAPNVNLIFTFDSSGTLKTQIEEGAVCDLFISAAQKQMNQLDAADTTGTNEGLDFVLSDTRIARVWPASWPWPRSRWRGSAWATTTCRWEPTPSRSWIPWALISPPWKMPAR